MKIAKKKTSQILDLLFRNPMPYIGSQILGKYTQIFLENII